LGVMQQQPRKGVRQLGRGLRHLDVSLSFRWVRRSKTAGRSSVFLVRATLHDGCRPASTGSAEVRARTR
jgi:hypothetical protein